MGVKGTSHPEITNDLQVFSETIARINLANKLGTSFAGERDLYKALGYKKDLSFSDYFSQYERQDIAKAVIDKPVSATWQGTIEIIESKEAETTPLETAWKELNYQMGVKSKLVLVDKLTGIGRYGAILLGLSDSANMEEEVRSKKTKLLFLRALGEDSIKVNTYETNVTSPRYGKPLYYDLTLQEGDTKDAISKLVHHSRIIHVCEDAICNEVFGTPRLQAVFNRLQDIEKVVGGSAEMFWRGARPGYEAVIDPEFTMSAEVKEDLRNQISEYENNLRRILVNKGIKLNPLTMQISDPAAHVDIQLQMISAETNIPKRILIGSERGELASTQDSAQWYSFIQSRRLEFAEPTILRPLINRLMEYGILPKVLTYEIKWSDLFAPSEKETAEVGRIRAAALKDYISTPGADYVVPPEGFLEFFCGFSTAQIELITKMREDSLLTDDTPMQEESENNTE